MKAISDKVEKVLHEYETVVKPAVAAVAPNGIG
jgi:hypothetical protein